MNGIDISVIILVKNGQRYLDLLLKAVFSQKIGSEFELTIVDSGSKDKTLDIIKNYPVRLYQIEEKDFNHGLTRNFAITKSQGKYIVLMTQDAIPYNNLWMEKLLNCLESDPRVTGVYSMQIPHEVSQPLTRIRANRFFTSNKIRKESKIEKIEDYNKLSPKEKHRLCNFDNVSCCIRKEVWEKVPFPKTDFGEDIEWSEAVLKRGYKIIYEPESIVYHSHDFSILGWYRRCRKNSSKIYSIFGVNTINNLYKLLAVFFIHTFRDFYYLCKNEGHIKKILSSFYLIPLFSFSEALGQYRGLKDSFSSE